MHDLKATSPGRPDDPGLAEAVAEPVGLDRPSTAPHVPDVDEAHRRIDALAAGVVGLGHALADDLDGQREKHNILVTGLKGWVESVEDRLYELEGAAGLRRPWWKRIFR